MTFHVTLDLTPVGTDREPASAAAGACSGFRREDYRLHPGAGYSHAHWLLRHPYGRDVLITKLREMRPDLQFMRYRTPPELEPFLEAIVDLLQMRDWPEPQGLRERVKAGMFLIRLALCQSVKTELPQWRETFASQGA